MIIRQHFGERWTRRIPSIKDWTASADGSVELSVESGQADIIAAWFNDTEIVVTFYLDDDTFFRGPAFIQSQNFNNDAGDAPELSISIEGNGALTYVGPAGAMPLAATTAATTTKKGE
jgi:predicted secreted protein